MFAGAKPDWNREGRDWPNRDASRFVLASGLWWHVQVMGAGPVVLLLHGSGAATHSWRDVAPLLARDFTVVAPDLPGHGFTETPGGDGLTLPGMAREVSGLLATLGLEPAVVVGHSAGVAIALRMSLDREIGRRIVGFNGALQPFPGAAGTIFPAMAKLLFLNPLAQQAFAWRASRPGAVERLIESTGSHIDPRGIAAYQALLGTTGHIAGALGMMAGWNLSPLQAELPQVSVPVTLATADKDLATPPRISEQAHTRIPGSTLLRMPGLGHLAHEEDPKLAARIVRDAAAP